MPAVLERCAELRAELLLLDPARLSGEDCRALAEELARTEKACAAARARAATRVAACGTYRTGGFSAPAEWLARCTGATPAGATAELEVAAAAQACPLTSEALAAGELSMAQAGEIIRTETACPGSEAELLKVASSAGLRALKEAARRRRLAAADAEELAARHHQARRFRHWVDAEGMVAFAGALEPTVGVGLMTRIDAEADRIRRQTRRRGEEPSFDALGADALVALCAGGGKGRPGGRADVVFVCDLRAYRRGVAEPGEAVHVVGAGPVPVSAIRELVEGDAFVKAVVHDGVRIDTVAHLGRHIPAHLRTALELGAPPDFEGVVCTEPGCGRRLSLEWDHVNPRANRGPTSYENLKGRCRRCHREKTERDRAAGLLGTRRQAQPAPPGDGRGPPF